MHDPEVIWRLGRWIARRESGSAHLRWSDGSAVLRLRRGHVVSFLGPDPATLAERLGCQPIGEADLLVEAREIAARRGIPETQAVAGAKELLQRALGSWLLDDRRELELEESQPGVSDGPTISMTHAVVELVLSETEQDYSGRVLPDLDLLVRRAGNFLELYSPLRLSEEADLVVAKITGQRTAAEIAGRSPHGSEEVVRLLAALVATGMLEPLPASSLDEHADLLAVELPEHDERRRVPVRWIAAAAAALALVLVVVSILVVRSRPGAPQAAVGTSWGVVVDMGCEPQELQRVLTKARQHPTSLRPQRADTGDDSPCWRLVWGRFPTREAALEALPEIPKTLILGGFQPHPVEVPAEESSGGTD